MLNYFKNLYLILFLSATLHTPLLASGLDIIPHTTASDTARQTIYEQNKTLGSTTDQDTQLNNLDDHQSSNPHPGISVKTSDSDDAQASSLQNKTSQNTPVAESEMNSSEPAAIKKTMPNIIAKITPLTLRYDVEYAGQNAGELEISLNTVADELKVNSTSHLSNLAKLFLDPYTIETRFKIENNNILILSGATKHANNNEIQHGFKINHNRLQVLFHSGESVNFNAHDDFEADSFPIKLITSELKTLKGDKVLAISGKRITEYAYTDMREEPLNINGKIYNTMRITRSKTSEPDRTVTFWLDQDNHNLPVKIISKSGGVNTELRIKT